jgi:hypothetical protein
VVALKAPDFEKEVRQDRDALVKFYAPWFAPLSPLSLCLVVGPDPWFVVSRSREAAICWAGITFTSLEIVVLVLTHVCR